MPDPEDFDARTIDRIRRFADAGLADFDLERIVARATEPSRKPYRMLAAAVIATTVIGIGAIVGAIAVRQPETPFGDTSGPASPVAPRVTATPSPAASVPESVPSLPIEPPPPSAAPSGGLTRTEAIEAARRAAPHAADYAEVTVASAGPFGTEFGLEFFDYSERPADNRWVWVIRLCDGCGPLSGQSTLVVLDYLDGRVYLVANFRG